MLRIIFISIMLFISLIANDLKPSVKNLIWDTGTSFLNFLEKNKIPVSLFYKLSNEDKELAAEIVAGISYQILYEDNEISQVLIPVNEELQIHIYKDNNSEYKLEFSPILYQKKQKVLNIVIEHSISQDIYEHSGSNSLVLAFIDAFKGENNIDFKKIKKGDKVVIIYEQKERLGRNFGSPVIQAAIFQNSRSIFRIYRYNDKFYNKEGKQKDKFFLVRPLKTHRITSKFTLKRWHPILRRYRAHLGVDYGAPRGTPVKSAGDGKVKFKGIKNGFGNVIVIKHSKVYETLYAHLNGFAREIKVGQTIKQGTLIGYVGNTGLSSGPHLHFGLYKNSKAIDPESMLKIYKSIESKRELAKFKRVTDNLDLLLNKALKSPLTEKFKSFSDVVRTNNE